MIENKQQTVQEQRLPSDFVRAQQAKDKMDKLIRHITNVQKTAQLLGERLIDRGEIDFGLQLIANSLSHDRSKFRGIEWEYLVSGKFDNPDTRLAARHHILTNKHHPEYWGGIAEMPRVYVAEMVCDWYSRSTEFGENIWDYVHGKALTRYNIQKDSQPYLWIKDFLDLILDIPFEESPD